MSEYCKKRKCYVDENGQPVNYLYQSSSAKTNTLHDQNVEAKTMSVEESMIVGDRLNNQIEISGKNSGSPTITISGSETNVGLTLSTKGTGGLKLDNSLEIVKKGSSMPTISASGSDADIDIQIVPKGKAKGFYTNANIPDHLLGSNIEFLPKGMGVTMTGWGYYERVRLGTQTLLAAGSESINFGNFLPVSNSFPNGSLTVTDFKNFKNTSGRTVTYVISYKFGTNSTFNGQMEGAIAKYSTTGTLIRYYAVHRSRGNGSEHVHVHGTSCLRLLHNESFDIQGDASSSVAIGNLSGSADSTIHIVIQQIA